MQLPRKIAIEPIVLLKMNSGKDKRFRKSESKRKPYRITLISGLVGASILLLFELVSYYGECRDLAFAAPLGLFIGFLAAPEIEPKHFKLPVLWQLIFGGGSADYCLVFSWGLEVISQFQQPL